jgi:hypothetical protein
MCVANIQVARWMRMSGFRCLIQAQKKWSRRSRNRAAAQPESLNDRAKNPYSTAAAGIGLASLRGSVIASKSLICAAFAWAWTRRARARSVA